jgi:hypothetical protein
MFHFAHTRDQKAVFGIHLAHGLTERRVLVLDTMSLVNDEISVQRESELCSTRAKTPRPV